MKTWIPGTLATFRFELQRSLTSQRVAVMAVLALFPPLMIGLMIGTTRIAESAINSKDRLTEEIELVIAHEMNTVNFDAASSLQIVQGFTPFAIVFLVSLVCLLSLLLWATSNVYSELEGKSWGFIASRPGGRIAIYFGKYLAAVAMSLTVSVIAMTLSVYVADRLLVLPDPERLWLALLGVYSLACFVYGAIFSLMGTLFYKRSMVVAAGYLIGSELFLASIPAVIGKLTMRFHLQELGIRWIGFFLPFDTQNEYQMLYGAPWPTWGNLLVLIGTGLLTLVVGAWVIVNRQYIAAEES